MGVRIEDASVLLVDNEAVVKNTTLPSSALKKKHNAIAYHKVREAVAAGMIRVAHVRSQQNIADILTKPLSPQSYYELLKKILFKREHSGDQGDLERAESHRTPKTQQPLSDPQVSSTRVSDGLQHGNYIDQSDHRSENVMAHSVTQEV